MSIIRLTKHFTLAEATKTSQPYDNSPDSDEDLATIQRTAMYMEDVRALLGHHPIIINSWYRSTAVNNAVGGVSNSQHKLGEAVDFTCPQFGDPKEICLYLERSGLPFDQLILEPTWVHISFNTSRAKRGQVPRREVLTMFRNPTRYVRGIAR